MGIKIDANESWNDNKKIPVEDLKVEKKHFCWFRNNVFIFWGNPNFTKNGLLTFKRVLYVKG